jgi:asparagine synthase (glutamine-hydrolysing)
MVEAMMTRLRHRGPDGEGLHRQHPITLGHCRLSIIDLHTGAQPMANEDGRVWVTYNGELYNFRELRNQLEASGHVFRTVSDTEVIVHAWEEWGEKCVERFRGMFAFVIADYRRGELFLARDHLGIKPLYYFQTGKTFAFASELQSLRAHDDCPDEIDPRAIDNYLRLLYIPPPRTIYRGVYKLPPGHRMTVTFDGKVSGPESYWTLKFRPETGISLSEWDERFEAALRDSVRAHLVSDVPFGAFLSGGLDSTSIVAMMVEKLSSVRTFSIGFEEVDFNELPYAREAARILGTDHHVEIVGPDSFAILPDLVRHYGEPFGDSSAIPSYFAARLARRQVTMVLTGDGGDECFLGYNKYLEWQELITRSSPHLKTNPPGLQDWVKKVTAIDSQTRFELLRPEFAQFIDEPIDEFEQIGRDAFSVPLEQFGQYLDFKTYLPHDLLTKIDVASMMHSLEARTPLCDVRMAEFAATIPWQINLRQNADTGAWTGKHLLKRFLSKSFGHQFLHRDKGGFSLPLKHWFSEGGPLRQELKDRFFIGTARIHRYLCPDRIKKLVTEHPRVRKSHQPLWQLLFLENWLEHVHDPAISAAVTDPGLRNRRIAL